MSVWFTHAIVAFLAWGLFAPFATFLSSFRTISFSNCSSNEPLWDRRRSDPNENDTHQHQGREWLKIHRYASETAILLTWVAFILACCGTKQEHHFKRTHHIVGLLIFLLTFPLWISGRVSMPPKTFPPGNTQIDENSTLIHQLNAPNDNGDGSRIRTVTTKEIVLIWLHRIVGTLCLIFGIWEIYSGILLYTRRTPEWCSFLLHAYVYWFGFLVVLMVSISPLVTLMRR
jgi:hypothetical protein